MVLFEGERGRKLVGDLPASKWELDTIPDLSSYKRTTDHYENDVESDDKGIRRPLMPASKLKVDILTKSYSYQFENYYAENVKMTY